MSLGNSELLKVTRQNLQDILREFPGERTKLVELAKKRRVINEKAKFEVERLIRIKSEIGEASSFGV